MHIQIRSSAAARGVCLLLAGVALAVLPAPALAGDEAGKNKAAYTQKLHEIKQECDTARTDLMGRYRKTLDVLRQAGKQKGDLDAVQAMDEEIKRFEKQNKLPPVTPPPANPDVAKAAALCREALDKADLDGARKVIDLTERYVQILDKNVKQAVRDDKLDLAKAYDTELKTAKETSEYQAAKFLVAEKTAAEPPAANPADTPPATDPTKTPAVVATNIPPPVLAPTRVGKDGEKIQPHVDPEGLYDAVRIFEGSPPVTLGTPTSYKKLASSETGKAPLTGGVGVAMDGYLDGENAKYQLLIKLRTKSAGTSFVNLKVLAQYFVKNPNGGGIQEARMQFVLVSSLGVKGTSCEMKLTDLPFAYTYRYRGGNFVEDREGAFVGVVISVFSTEDKLLGQVSSATALKDKGKTAFELPKNWEDHVWDTMPQNNPGGTTGIRPRRRRADDNN